MRTAALGFRSPINAALDVIRAGAAIYVVIHHLCQHEAWQGIPGFLFRFGQESVIIFFILSGFVIFLNESHRAEQGILQYYMRRARRIYPPLLVALLISTLIFLDNGDLRANFSLRSMLATVFNVIWIQPGVADPYLRNGPLWSLSYEVFCYLIFPFVLMGMRKYGARFNHVIGAVCCVSYIIYLDYPNYGSLALPYFMIWWCGARVAQEYLAGRNGVKPIFDCLLWLVVMALAALAVQYLANHPLPRRFPMIDVRHLLFSAFVASVFSFRITSSVSYVLVRMAKPAAVVASISYGIYIFHYPLLIQWKKAQSPYGFILAIALLIVLSWQVDRGINRRFKAPG